MTMTTGIQIKYAELLRLSVEQLFYQNKVYKQTKSLPQLDMLLTPTAYCLAVMNRLNFVYKNTDASGGLIVLARVAGNNGAGNDLLRFPAAAGDKLSFLITLKNKDVINFNDLPVQPADNSVYYFSNEVVDAGATRDKLHLSKSAAGVDGANDVVKTSKETYRFHSASVIEHGTAKVKHTATGQFIEPSSIVTTGGQSDLTFMLSSLPMGKCQLLINNVPEDEFFYLEKYAGQPLFGIIEFSLSSTLAANYRIIEPDRSLAAQKPLYILTFNSRSTFWRYTVRLQTNSPLYLEMAALSPADKTDFINKLNILTNDTTITFSRTIATDTEFVFVSNGPLLLREKYFTTGVTPAMLTVKLTKYIGDAREAVVKDHLPYASTNQLDATSPPKVYSDIFLTL